SVRERPAGRCPIMPPCPDRPVRGRSSNEGCMSDYGHPIKFGAFLTPAAQGAQELVALVEGCERAGMEVVSFQDHPYQARFLDTWTLLSFLAARTSSVKLAPNVLNLPLRPPSVIARAAASLDILSGG